MSQKQTLNKSHYTTNISLKNTKNIKVCDRSMFWRIILMNVGQVSLRLWGDSKRLEKVNYLRDSSLKETEPLSNVSQCPYCYCKWIEVQHLDNTAVILRLLRNCKIQCMVVSHNLQRRTNGPKRFNQRNVNNFDRAVSISLHRTRQSETLPYFIPTLKS